MKNKTLSIIIPVYNEKNTVLKILEKIEKLILPVKKEIILIDDFSTDGTREILKKLKHRYKIIFNKKNKGKGAAIKTGIKYASGDFIIVQDADLEYNPKDYKRLLKPIMEDGYSVVYGSRFLKTKHKRLIINYYGNKILTFFTNLLYDSNLTDVWTCYKLFKIDVVKELNLRSEGFGFEQEVTTKIIKKGLRIKEIPINYTRRSYDEGKKITYTDGLKAIYYLFKFRFSKK